MSDQVFLPAHAAALLAYVTSVDERFSVSDEATAVARLRAWVSILSDVDPGFALQHGRRYYSKPGQPRLTPAEVRNAWIGHLRRQDARQRPRLARSTPPPVGLKGYLAAVAAVVAAGGDPAGVPVPEAARISPEADQASRKCREWRSCACDHTKCRDGWLDQEQTITNGLGMEYPAVEACPHCRDAALMAAELATPVRGRR